MTRAAATSGDLDRSLLDRLGIRPELLLSKPTPVATPTFDEYIDRVSAAVPAGMLRDYRPYWRKLKGSWGSRPINVRNRDQAVRP